MQKTTTLLSLALLMAVFFSACSKDHDDDHGPGGPHTVVYKAMGSSNIKISSVGYMNDQGDPTIVSDLDVSTWTSPELTIPASVPVVMFSAEAISTDNQPGELKVQIIVDGAVKKENSGTGSTVMTASTSITF